MGIKGVHFGGKCLCLHFNCCDLCTELTIVTVIKMVFCPEDQAVHVWVFSLDITHMDFSVWSFVKDTVYKTRVNNIAEFRQKY